MKYIISLLVISVIIISSFNFYNAYAANTLSFDYTSIVLEHSSGITCLQCSVTGNAMNVTLSSPGNTNLIITLTRTTGTSDFFSPWIKFTATGTTGGTNFVTSGTHVISATTTTTLNPVINSAAPATISTNWSSLLSNNSLYARNAAIISPNDATICNNNGGDNDGDGICQNWETRTSFPAGSTCANSGHNGLCIRTSPTAPIYWLDCGAGGTTWKNMCPDSTKDDLYFEIDYMAGHRPSDATLDKIYNAFLNSPSSTILHIQLDEQLPHVNVISSSGNFVVPGYDQLKYWWFGTSADRGNSLPNNFDGNPWMLGIRSQKAQVFHYVIFAHQQQGNTGSSGVAEMPGNDIMISLGSFTGGVGTQDQQQGTLLHEMGHNLGLDHGGSDGINCKPNYLSVMSYSRQFSDLVSNRPLDYSHSLLNTLNENALVENTGIIQSDPINLQTVYGPPALLVTTVNSAINWNRVNPSTETVAMDINNMGTTGCPALSGQTLYGFNDWGYTLKLFDHGGVGSVNGTSNPSCPPGTACSPAPTGSSAITCASAIGTGCDNASSNNPNATDTTDTRPTPIIYMNKYSPSLSLVKKDTLDQSTIMKVEYMLNSNDTVNSGKKQELVTHIPLNPNILDKDSSVKTFVENTWSDDGMHAPLIYNELNISDVAVMRDARINSIINLLDNIPADQFVLKETTTRDLYQSELESIKTDINNITNDNSMFDAYNKMQAFESRFDGKGDNEILVPDSKYLNSTQILIADIIESQSKALPEFSTFSIIVLAVVFTSIVFFFRKQFGFSSKLGYANI